MPVDDDDDEPETPRKPLKKPARPADDAVRKEAPRPMKKPAPRPPIDNDDETEADVPRRTKKTVRRRDEDDDQEEEKSLREHTGLNLLAPVGGSVWGLAAFICGFIGAVVPIVLAVLYWLHHGQDNFGKFGYVIAALGVFIALLTLPFGGLSFIFRPKKGNYGGIASYMRAIVGILLGLIGIGFAIVFFVKPTWMSVFG
jgi:hypothetical protein